MFLFFKEALNKIHKQILVLCVHYNSCVLYVIDKFTDDNTVSEYMSIIKSEWLIQELNKINL